MDLEKTDYAFIRSIIVEAIEKRTIAVIPRRDYVLDNKLSFVFNTPEHLIIEFEDGATVTRKAGSIRYDWSGLFQFVAKVPGCHISIEGFSGTTNASGNPANGNVEHSACVYISGIWESINVAGFRTWDNVADGLWLGGEPFGTAQISNVTGEDRTRPRSDITISSNGWDYLSIKDCDVTRFDIEPDHWRGSEGITRIENLTANHFDYGGKGHSGLLKDILVREFAHFGDSVTDYRDCVFNSRRMQRITGGSHTFENCIFSPTDDFSPGQHGYRFQRGLLYHTPTGGRYLPDFLRFDRCKIKKGRGENPPYFYWPNEPPKQRAEFIRCVSGLPILPTDRAGTYLIDAGG